MPGRRILVTPPDRSCSLELRPSASHPHRQKSPEEPSWPVESPAGSRTGLVDDTRLRPARVIAVDTNILVYAHREDAAHHAAALRALQRLAEAGRSWAVPWPCVHEFFAIITHRRIFTPPSGVEDALKTVSDLLELSGVTILGEGTDHLQRLARLLRESGVVGPKVHDARIAAICMSHGVGELWTADRDFSYFPDLATRNPLV